MGTRRQGKKAVTKVYIVVHHEIFEDREQFRDDEMVFYVVSSLKIALKYIKKSGVNSYSWWEILEHDLDSDDWPNSLGHYGRRGGKLKSPPFTKAVELYKKCKADPRSHLNVLPRDAEDKPS
jgi:hypothetical protein